MSPKPVRTFQTTRRTPAHVRRDAVIREKYMGRPSLEQLVDSSEVIAVMSREAYGNLMEFMANIRQARRKCQLSLADLAAATGIDKAALSRLENGQSENPTIATLERIANALGKRVSLGLVDISEGEVNAKRETTHWRVPKLHHPLGAEPWS